MARKFNSDNNKRLPWKGSSELNEAETQELLEEWHAHNYIERNSATPQAAFSLGERLLSGGRMMSSSRVFTTREIGNAVNFSGVDETWKSEAFYYYDYARPEVKKIVDMTARGVSSCELQIGWQRPEGTIQALTDDPELNMLLRDLDGPGGDYRQIMESIAGNLQVTGDGFLIGKPVKEGESIVGYEDWEFVSVDEIHVAHGSGKETKILRDATGGIAKFSFNTHNNMDKDHLEDYFIARGWRRSLRYSQLSTSSLKTNLKICKLLTKLEDLVEAIANSQLPGGILIVPEEASFGPVEEGIDGGEQAEDIIDQLTEELLDFIGSAVDDRSSAASIAPIILRIKAEFADKVKMVRLARDLDAQTSVIRQELYERLSIGLDAPPEALDGKSGVNNWTGYQIDAEFASKHIIPLGHMISDFLTRNYLWPMLEFRIRSGASNKSIEEIKRYRFIFNPRNIMARIDKATLAIRLCEMGKLSAEATVQACGFEITDMPTLEEQRQDLIIDLFTASPKTLAPLLLPHIRGLEGIELPQGLNPLAEGLVGEENNRPTQDNDARGDGPRRTPDESPGTEPRSDRINDDRGPGGDREDDRQNPNRESRLSNAVGYDLFLESLVGLASGTEAVRPNETQWQALTYNYLTNNSALIGKSYDQIEHIAFTFAKQMVDETILDVQAAEDLLKSAFDS